jgi:Domain of unknown function (DUF4402)
MRLLLPLLVAMLAATPAAAEEPCTGCANSQAQERPLTIEIYTGIAFDRMAMTGHSTGSAAIDPQTGGRSTDNGLVGLGGMAIQGHGRITGTPMKPVRIDLPNVVRMTSPEGGNAELTDFTTDLPAFPTLDESGELEFTFGGTLHVSNGSSGRFRGRIPITVDYN